MIITLSEERNEKLILEWSGEITDEHAQGFCDVCNAVFNDHFDLDYMRRRYYEENIYGKSFFVTVCKDGIPSAALGAWREDFDGRPAFHLIDFASLPSERKSGYALDMLYAVFDEVRKIPGAVTFAITPGPMSYPLYEALGFAVVDVYLRPYSGMTRDFLENMPVIDDDFAEAFFTKKKNVYVKELRGKYYLFLKRRIKRIVPAGIFLGEVRDEIAARFKKGGFLLPMLYYSLKEGRFPKYLKKSHTVLYDPSANEQVMAVIPPVYKLDVFAMDFNGRNHH